MTLPKRHRRNITYDGHAFHWYFPQGRDVDHRSDFHLIVQEVNGKGQVLRLYQESWNEVTPAFVTSAIAEALASGWHPDEPGPPFTLTRPSA